MHNTTSTHTTRHAHHACKKDHGPIDFVIHFFILVMTKSARVKDLAARRPDTFENQNKGPLMCWCVCCEGSAQVCPHVHRPNLALTGVVCAAMLKLLPMAVHRDETHGGERKVQSGLGSSKWSELAHTSTPISELSLNVA